MSIKASWNKALTQIIFVGFLAFCCPGLFNSLNGLGKAGGSNADIANAANATLYGCFALFGYFGGAFFNIFGNRLLMFVGGLTYAFYAVGIYISSNVENAGFVAVLSGALLGFGAGWFWTAQGAMMMSYATADRKGAYVAYFWALFNIGGVFGGILTMAINWNTEQDEASAASYFVFVGLMLAGGLGGLLLSNPNSVIREDGQPVRFELSTSFTDEIIGALKVSTNRDMLLLTPLFLSSIWFYAYQFNAINGSLFNVRSRGLNSALYWGFQMIGAVVSGKIVDRVKRSPQSRGWTGCLAMALALNLAFALSTILQFTYNGGSSWDKTQDSITGEWIGPFTDLVDIGDSREAVFPIIILLIFALGNAMLQSYAYWLMAMLAGENPTICARYAGYYKGVQSLGACISWLLDLYIPYIPQLFICWGLHIASLPGIIICVNRLPTATKDNQPVLDAVSTIEIPAKEPTKTDS